MEKIKTPLGRIINEKKKQVKSLEYQVEKLHQMRYVADRILECRNKIYMINNDIQFLESYLPTERNMMINIHCSGQVCAGGKGNIKVAESCLKEKYHPNI